jgi:hypothetical protein
LTRRTYSQLRIGLCEFGREHLLTADVLIENSSYEIEASREKDFADVKKAKDTAAKGKPF